jgi:aminocarboxymuconate-semialdehyde decarboxylase
MASSSSKIDKMKRIDIHTHVLFPAEEEGKVTAVMPRFARDDAGQEVIQIRGRSFRGQIELHDPKRRIQDMDNKGIDMQVLSLMPVFIFYDVDPELGLACSQIHNNAIAAMVKTYPDRFVGLATVPLQAPGTAAKELRRAMNELGLNGVQILSDVNGKNLDWPELWPFYEMAQELGAFILCHPKAFSVMDRMKKFHLQNLVGHPFDTSLAIASVIFGGVLRDFPRLKLCFLHGGGFAPYQRGRFEHGYQVRPECKEMISKPPSEYFRLLHFDTVTHYDPALEYLIRTVGSDMVLMGSDYPADMADADPVATITRLEPILDVDKENIFGKNAARLLGL